MYPRIMHIYGPFWIQSYGLMIVLGFLVFLFFTYNNKKRRDLINDDLFFNTLFLGLISGLVFGRALFVFYEWNNLANPWVEMFWVWNGGFVILGSIIGVLATLPLYLWWKGVPVLKFLDIIAIYAPLIQSFGRIGCFLAGCCYGAECHSCLWSVTFSNVDGLAPLNVPLHPTQLYLCATSFLIFIILYLLRNCFKKDGQISFAYLTLDTLARFVIDFYRGDRVELSYFSFLNLDLFLSEIQIWLLTCLFVFIAAFCTVSFYKRK